MGALTAFGREVRRLRFEREETLRDMAAALKKSAAFISAVEIGEKSIPEGLVIEIARHFGLNEIGRRRLEDAAAASVRSVTIQLASARDDERELAAVFARRFPSLSDEKKEALRRLLGE